MFKAFCRFFGVGIFVFCTSAVRADFNSPAKNISNSLLPSWCPKISASAGSTNLYVIWREEVDDFTDHLCFSKSPDQGATWSAPVELTSQGQIRSSYFENAYSMSVDEPYVHIVFNWRADATDDWEIRYCRSNDCGETWPLWTQLTNNDTSSLYPDVAARGSYVHVTYQDDWAGNFEVMYKRITNYGAGAVDQTRRLTFSDSDSYLPQIAVSMSGLSVNIVYEDTIDTTLDIFYKHIYSSGAGPYDTRRITFGIYQEDYNSFSDIATSSGTDDQFVYIAYNGHWPGNSEIMYKRLDNWGQGGFIMYSARLTYSSTVSSMAAIAFDSIHNDVHISYLDYWPGNSDVMHRKLPDYGGDGYSAQRISWGSGDSNYSSIASSDVWTFVAWSDNTSGNYEIYFKRGT